MMSVLINDDVRFNQNIYTQKTIIWTHSCRKMVPITHDPNHDKTLRGSRGGGRGPDPYPLKNHKTIGFLSNTGPEKSQSYKASIQCWAIVSVIGVTLRAALDPLQFVDFMRGYRKFCQFDNVFFFF